MNRKITILSLLMVLILTSGFGCKISSKETKKATEPITLSYWRVFDGPDTFKPIIDKYNALHPFIKINYRKLRYTEYEDELLNALAEDRGPDIFSIHNTWIRKYKTKIAPMPTEITMAYPVVSGSVKKELTTEIKTTRSISTNELRDKFVDVVSHDVIIDNNIYALPLSVDTLALYYNKDLFNNAGISQAPLYWNKEFLQDIKKLTKQDPRKGIIQSAIALGGSSNIERFSDILSVLMMQNGATMMEDGQVLFNTIPEFAQQTNYSPGLDALRFYTDFSNQIKESYSWNDELPNSLDMFISGNLAMFFGYSYDLPVIKTQAPKLNFSISYLPQIEGNPPTNINFANYWVETVSQKSAHINEAWDFIQFMTKAENVKEYLDKANKPTALRSLINTQKNKNNDISIFIDQVLTAKSWYLGKNVIAAEKAMKEMIDRINNKTEERLKDIIGKGAAKIQQTIY